MNTTHHAHKRPWTEYEDKLLWEQRYSMRSREIGEYLGRTHTAVQDRLRHLRARHGRECAGPERQIVADEVVKELTRHVVSGRLSVSEALRRIERLAQALAKSDAVILSRTRWSVSDWVNDISP